MKKILQWLFFPGNYDALPAALAGFFILLAFTRHGGIGVSPDSVVYMSVAANFHDHGLLMDYGQVPIVDFPCFYPVFLSLFMFLTGLGVMSFAPVLNGLLFAFLIWLCGRIMEEFFKPGELGRLRSGKDGAAVGAGDISAGGPGTAGRQGIPRKALGVIGGESMEGSAPGAVNLRDLAGRGTDRHGGMAGEGGWQVSYRSRKIYKHVLLVLILLSPALLEIYSMLWSETLFVCWTLLLMPVLHWYFRTHSLRVLLLAGGITALSIITRYAGITLAGLTGLLILLDTALPLRKKIRHLALFGVVASSLLIANLVRNRLVQGTLTGYREKGVTPFLHNMRDMGAVFCDWLPFFNGRYGWALFVACFWILLFLALFIRRSIAWLREKRPGFYSYENIAMAFFIVYFLFMVFSATVSRFQTLNSRLLSPLFIPWVWGASSWLPGRQSLLPTLRRMGMGIMGGVAAACLLWGQWQTDYETWDGVRDAGIPGYTEDPWQQSETIKYVRENKPAFLNGYTVYSNAPDAIWFLTGLHSDMVPHKDFGNDIQEFLAEKSFTIIIFNDGANPDLLHIDYINQHKHLVSTHAFDDGVVYVYADPR